MMKIRNSVETNWSHWQDVLCDGLVRRTSDAWIS